MSRKQRHKRKQFKWVVPSFAMIVTALLIVFVIHTGVFNQDESSDQFAKTQEDMREIDHDEHRTLTASELDEDEAVDNDEPSTEPIEEDATPIEENGEAIDFDSLRNHLVYYNDEHNLPLYTIGVMDMQAMYAIPITLVDTAATGVGYPNDVYNRLSTFIDEDEFGVYEYPYDEIEFIISDDLHHITMRVADDFVIPDTSSQLGALTSTLNLMFADYPATEINLETETNDYIDFGQIGVKETLPLEPAQNLAYKIYQYEDQERLLIPIPYTVTIEQFYTIDEALLEMQYDQEAFNITGTIPADVDYTLDPSNQDVLTLTFESDSVFGDNQMTKEMIESILFTAESFGFNHVDFDLGEAVTQVGQFDLTTPVPIPDGINPVLLD